MNDFHGSQASVFTSNFGPALSGADSFAPPSFGLGQLGSVSSRSLMNMQPTCAPTSVTPDGSKFFTNDEGEIVFAHYASGAVVIKQTQRVAVRTADGDYWMGDSKTGWFRID